MRTTPSRATFWLGAAALVGAMIWTGPWSVRSVSLDAAAAAPAAKAAPAQKPPSKPGPHPQADLPPLQLPKFQLSRPKDQVVEIYHFAAEHPEILGYVACFCGCNRLGHKDNEDCFVKARNAKGDVTEWQDHGFMCPMCLSIGYDSMKMYQAGISLSDIREEIDRKYGHTGMSTPTPMPPATPGKGKTGPK